MKQRCLIHTGLSEYFVCCYHHAKQFVRKCPLVGFLPTRISPGKRRWETYTVLPYVLEDGYRIALSHSVLGSKENDRLKLRGGCNGYDS